MTKVEWAEQMFGDKLHPQQKEILEYMDKHPDERIYFVTRRSTFLPEFTHALKMIMEKKE